MATQLFSIVALFQVPDATNAAIQGAFRGVGMQNFGAKLNFVAYYIIGLPIGSFFAFQWSFGLVGLYVGLATGLSFVCAYGIFELQTMNWSALVQQAKFRTLRSPTS